MNNKYFPIISALLVSLAIFSVIVVVDTARKKRSTTQTPVVQENTEFLGATRDTVPTEIDLPDSTEKAFKDFKNLVKSKPGVYGLYIKDLSNGAVYAINEDHYFYSASLFKLPLAIATYKEIERGTISIDQVIEYKEEDTAYGAGQLQSTELGGKYTIDELLNYMMKSSDNVAQNMITRIIGRNAVTIPFPEQTKSGEFPIKINATPLQVAEILEGLHYDLYIKTAHGQELIERMSSTDFDNRINTGLSPGITYAHKIGNWQTRGTWHDCGLATHNKTVLVCLMSEDTTFNDFLEVSQQAGIVISTLFK